MVKSQQFPAPGVGQPLATQYPAPSVTQYPAPGIYTQQTTTTPFDFSSIMQMIVPIMGMVMMMSMLMPMMKQMGKAND
jgi:hypothetical protein